MKSQGQGRLWEKYDPSVYASFKNFKQNPSDFWEMMEECKAAILPSKPNPGHVALAELEKLGKLKCVITQNIDGLHQEAGNSVVYELHGNCKTAVCMDCSKKYSLEELDELLKVSKPPLCTSCSGNHVKSDVILFGEALPTGVIESAIQAVQNSDLLIVIGSSLQVSPANLLPNIAKSSGAKILLLNMSDTPIDHVANVVVRTPVGECLPRILKLVKGNSQL